MNWLAGAILYAGGIAQAIWAYIQAGGGAAGWEAARDRMRELYPAARANSIEAVISRAQDTVAVGRRYGPGGPDYAPQPGQLPDARPPERDAGLPPGWDPANPTPPTYYHEGEVLIYDARYGDVPIQRIGVTVNSPGVLTRQQLLDELQDRGQDWLETFAAYDDVAGRLDQLSFEVRIIGAYRGY